MNTHKKISIANAITYFSGLLLIIFALYGMVKHWYFNDMSIDFEAHFVVAVMGFIISVFSEVSSRNNNLRNK
jgi:membrane associated rhomboid family serine protease